MSLRNTNDEATLTLDGVVSSNKIILDNDGTVVLSTIVQDRGDGYRPFTPLTVKIDTVATVLPTLLAAGHHVIELTGAMFIGYRLALEGFGMLGVTAMSVDVLGTQISGSLGSVEPEADAALLDLAARVNALENAVSSPADLSAVNSRILTLEQSTRHEEGDIELNVTAAAGVAVTFTRPFAGADKYKPDAYGITADGSKVNCSWSEATANGITFWPDVDVVQLYWGAVEIR